MKVLVLVESLSTRQDQMHNQRIEQHILRLQVGPYTGSVKKTHQCSCKNTSSYPELGVFLREVPVNCTPSPSD